MLVGIESAGQQSLRTGCGTVAERHDEVWRIRSRVVDFKSGPLAVQGAQFGDGQALRFPADELGKIERTLHFLSVWAFNEGGATR